MAQVEPNWATDRLYKAVPSIYSPDSKIAILSLGPEQTLEEDTSDQLFESLCLDNNEMLRGDPMMLEQVKNLIQEYSDVFSLPEKEIGETSLIKFHVQLMPEAWPVKQKLPPLNP